MALLFLGQSTCLLCGEIMQAGEAIKGLPPFAVREHIWHQYFDLEFYAQCFDKGNKREEARALLEVDKRAFMNSNCFAAMGCEKR